MEHRVSTKQLEELLDYLASHSILVKGAGLGARSKETIDREWQYLAQRLNAHGSGATKTALRWKRYWADLKHKVKARAAARKQQHNQTGGGPSSEMPLSEIEIKVLNIIGGGAVYGDVEYTVPAFDYQELSKDDTPLIVIESQESQDLPPGYDSAALTSTHNIEKTPSKSGSTNPNTPEKIPYDIITTVEAGSPMPSRPGKVTKKKLGAQRKSNTKFDTSWIVELERRRVRAEEKLADAALVMAEATKVHAESLKIFSNSLTKILDYLVEKK